MTVKQVGTLPLNVTRMNSHIPCESCGYRRSKVKVEFNPPGNRRVEHRLCNKCMEGLR